MRNNDEFKALVAEKAAAQKAAVIVAARRRKMILSGVATLALCIAILLPVTGLLPMLGQSADDHVTRGVNSGGEGMTTTQEERYLGALQQFPALTDSDGVIPPAETDAVPEMDTQNPNTTEDSDSAEPTPPFSDDPPLTDSPVLDSITDPVAGLTAVNRLVGLKIETVEERKIDETFRRAYLNFTVKLFQGADGVKSDSNLCFSPLSVMLALSMTANGANGQTLAEMEDFLGGALSIEELNATLHTWIEQMTYRKFSESVLNAANSIWVRQSVFNASPAFLQTNANYYGAAFYEAPFDDSTVDDINLWIKHHTNGLIEKMVDEIDERTMMYLINTLYLEDTWSDTYYDDQLSDGTFHGIESDVTVTMMASEESTYLSMDGAVGFKKNMSDYTLAAILPDEGIDVGEFIASLSGEQLQAFLQSGTRAVVNAKLPSFSYDSSITLTDLLMPYIPTALNPSSADFSNMGETIFGSPLFIGSVQQNTTITVDQTGICAAAGTIIEAPSAGESPSDPIPVYDITLDRPFVYVITDSSTGLPVFIGVVEQL